MSEANDTTNRSPLRKAALALYHLAVGPATAVPSKADVRKTVAELFLSNRRVRYSRWLLNEFRIIGIMFRIIAVIFAMSLVLEFFGPPHPEWEFHHPYWCIPFVVFFYLVGHYLSKFARLGLRLQQERLKDQADALP